MAPTCLSPHSTTLFHTHIHVKKKSKPNRADRVSNFHAHSSLPLAVAMGNCCQQVPKVWGHVARPAARHSAAPVTVCGRERGPPRRVLQLVLSA